MASARASTVLRIALLAAGGMALVVGLALVALVLIILPRADDYRDDIAAAVSRAVGVPVEIESVSASWPGLRLRLDVRGVVLGDPVAADALRLERLEAYPGWSSILRGAPYFHRVVLIAPDLALVRDALGNVRAAGLQLGSGDGAGGFSAWLLNQGELSIVDARVSWLDEMRGPDVLRLDRVGLRVERIAGRYRFELNAVPDGALAGSMELRGDAVSADPTDPARWNGELYAAVRGARLDGLEAWVDYPLSAGGIGDVEIWLDFAEGRPARSTVDFSLHEFVVQVHESLPALDAQRASGRIRGVERDGGVELEVSGFELVTEDGRLLQPERLSLRLDGVDRLQDAGRLSIASLDLEVVAGLAAHLPLPVEVESWLGELSPRGRVENFDLAWSSAEDGLRLTRLAARFFDVALRPRDVLPGAQGFSGEISGDRERGRFSLTAVDAFAELPRVFPEPNMRFAKLEAEGGWSRGDRGLEILLQSARFENPDAAGVAQGVYRPDVGKFGEIDLTARLTRAAGDAVWRYLPHVVNDHTRRWLQRGLLEADVRDARLILQGRIEDFPFRSEEGRFLVTVDVDGGRLDYAPGWPTIDDIRAKIRFEGPGMLIEAEEALIYGVRLSGVRAEIPELDVRGDQILSIDGQASGATSDFLRYIANSPVSGWIGGFTDGMSAEGAGDLALSLRIPLHDTSRTEVTGEYRFADNQVSVIDWLPPVLEARGMVRFTDRSFEIPRAEGRLLGHPLKISAATAEPGQLRFEVDAAASLRALSAHYDWPLTEHLSGTAALRAIIDAGGGDVRVGLSSTLEGVSSSLPAPLNKRSAEVWPLNLDVLFAGERREVSGRLGEAIGFVLEGFVEEGRLQLSRGGVGVNAATRAAEEGIALVARLDEFDLDRWREALAGGNVAGEGAALSDLDIQIGTLHAVGYRLEGFELSAAADSDGWSGRVSSDIVAGRLAWHGREEGAVQLRLDRLLLGKRDASDEDVARLLALEQSDSLPDMDVVAERFELHGFDLGRLELRASNERGEWLLESVTIENEDGTLVGTGRWRPGNEPLTRIRLRLDSRDVGRLLTRVGYPEVIRRGTALMEGDLAWAGVPTRVHYPSLDGQFAVSARNGRFSKLEPGVARLLGVLSLQALPRRLKLDFSDVFSEGFAFDRIDGSFAVAEGVMQSEDLEIAGPAARIWIGGSANLVEESQDLKVVVQPTLSESVAVGAAAGLINPVAGVIAYLAQKVLSDPIERMFAYGYSVTGSWADPQVERLPVGQGKSPSVEEVR